MRNIYAKLKKKTDWGKLYYNQALLRTGPHSIPFRFISESDEWRIAEEIQDWKSMAETVGRVHKLLSFLLQNTRGISVHPSEKFAIFQLLLF